MHFGFVKDIKPGYGEDAMRHGENYAIVCDGLGGKGANVLRREDGTVRTEAYVTANISVQLVEEIVLAGYPDWKSQLTDPTLSSRIAETLNQEIPKRVQEELLTWQYGSRQPIMPSTLACAVAFTEARRALIMWAGDSRVYMLDREHFSQLGKDDGVSDPPMDAMEELMFAAGSLPIGNRIGLDMPMNIHVKMIDLPEQALLLCTSDGIYNCLPTPMFEEYMLRSCYRFTSSDQLCEMLCQALSRTAQDDIALAGVYVDVGGETYARFQEMLCAGLESVKCDYVDACPSTPPSTTGYMDEDLIRARIFDRLQKHDGFLSALRSWLRKMEDGAPIPEKCCFAKQIQDYRLAKEAQRQLEQLRASQEFLQNLLPVPTEEAVRKWLSGIHVIRQKDIPVPAKPLYNASDKNWETLARNYSKFGRQISNLIHDLNAFDRHNCYGFYSSYEYNEQIENLLDKLFLLGTDQNMDLLDRIEKVFRDNQRLREDNDWLYKEFCRMCDNLDAAVNGEKSSLLSLAEQCVLLDAILSGSPLPETSYTLMPSDSEQLGAYRTAVRIANEHKKRLSDISTAVATRPSEQKFDPYALMQIAREWISAYCHSTVLFPVEDLSEAIVRDLENLKRAPEINQAITQATQLYEETMMNVWRRYKPHYEQYMYADVTGKPLTSTVVVQKSEVPAHICGAEITPPDTVEAEMSDNENVISETKSEVYENAISDAADAPPNVTSETNLNELASVAQTSAVGEVE